jgi:hypothetical protein
MAQRKRPPRQRTLERALRRSSDKLATHRERLFQLEPGSTPEHPIEISSPTLVEPKATALLCPRCELPFRVEAHRAPSVAGMRLREAEVSCSRCGARRSLWFRLMGPTLN